MNELAPSTAKTFSLVIGGPFYRALVRLHLVEPSPNVRLRIAVLVLLTWYPPSGLCLAHRTAFGNQVQMPLLRDFSIWGRFLAGLPLLIIAEVVIDPWIRRVVTFESSGIIRDEELPAFYETLGEITRLRDSGLAELGLMILAALPVFLFFDYEWISNGISAGVAWLGLWRIYPGRLVVRIYQ